MPRSLISELKRRNVWRAAALYGAAAWLVVQVATQVFPFLDISNGVVRGIIIAAVLGFPFWIAFAWLYELTPEGLKRESDLDRSEPLPPRRGRTMDRWIIGSLAAAVVLLLANTLVARKGGDLAGPAPAQPGSARTIAVLPFDSLSSDREQAYFADGVSEDILDLLTRVSALRVAARTSSFAFQGQRLEVQEIARRLNVANVLQGSVQRAGDRVRISVQLVRAADGYQVWSRTWERRLTDVFAVQDEIARDVASQLQVSLLGAAAPRARPTSPRAYALFLQARELGRQLRPDALLRSDSLARQVLALDARYAPAWTQLAHNFANESNIGVLSSQEGARRAGEAARRALVIDPASAPAHAELGRIAVDAGDPAGAARELEQALALDPTNFDVLASGAVLLQSLGRMKEAIALEEYLVARDPVNPTRLFNLGVSYGWDRRYDDAISRLGTVLTLSPDYGVAHYLVGVALLLKGDAPAARVQVQRETSEVWRLFGLTLVDHALGHEAASDSVLAVLIGRHARDWSYAVAAAYAYRGEADPAFTWLRKAVEQHDPGLWAVPLEPLFDPLHADARWLPFLRRIGKAPEQLATISFRVHLPGDGTAASAPGDAAPRELEITAAPGASPP